MHKKRALSKFREQSEVEVMKELTQLQVLEPFVPVDTTELTKKQRAEAVESLMLLKGERNGDIKGLACGDRIKSVRQQKTSTRVHLQFPHSQCL